VEVGTNCMLFRDGNHAVRLLKKAPNFVLSSSKSSTYPGGYASRFQLACGLVGWPF